MSVTLKQLRTLLQGYEVKLLCIRRRVSATAGGDDAVDFIFLLEL
jgi:hypothetical protein